ncbi:4Fe-4S dicluster domain-containing protein, partial [Nocardia sp. NPDC003648]
PARLVCPDHPTPQGLINHKTGKAEKCTFCYPRVEVGIPTVCSETCVGRLRYIGVMLYDADAVLEAASVTDDKDLYPSQLGVFLNPHDPRVIAEAEKAGISPEWIQAAQDSPVYKLIVDYQLALPLHPEYRTMPMVWYVPPLSPVVDVLSETGHDGEDAGNLFGAIDALRIPIEYLAELFTAGEIGPVRASLQRLAGMRAFMRSVNLGEEPEPGIAPSIGLEPEEIEAMYRLLAIAKYEHRYVIPSGATSRAHELDSLATGCSLDTDGGPGMTAFDQVVEKFSLADTNQAAPEEKSGRINLLNWDGRSTSGLVPSSDKLAPTANGNGAAAGSNGNGSNGAAVADSTVSGAAQ